jgi:hypothetical protein
VWSELGDVVVGIFSGAGQLDLLSEKIDEERRQQKEIDDEWRRQEEEEKAANTRNADASTKPTP